jgi:molybdenum cofactor synthesis domain-containing protein
VVAAPSPGLPGDARARVVTVSDRSAQGRREDSSGPVLADVLRGLGFDVDDVVVVPDDVEHVQAALREAVAAGVDVVLTTGGTGFSPRDITPEATRPLLDREAPGLPEALRRTRQDEVPTTVLSRGVAGTVGATFVLNLPGSTGAVRDAADVLAPVLGHLVAQLRGTGDHA